jgi:hypothetical protein
MSQAHLGQGQLNIPEEFVLMLRLHKSQFCSEDVGLGSYSSGFNLASEKHLLAVL